MTSQEMTSLGEGEDENTPDARNYVAGNYVAGNYVVEICIAVKTVKTARSMAVGRDPPPPDAVRWFLPPGAVFTVQYTYHVYFLLILTIFMYRHPLLARGIVYLFIMLYILFYFIFYNYSHCVMV